MAVVVNTQSILTVAEISQYLSQKDISNNINLGTGDINIAYPRLLYLVRQGVQWAFDQNPNDETLNATASYLYALCGRYINAAETIAGNDGCAAPVILTQPVSQTADDGDNVSFFVVAYAPVTMTYQWYKNGVLMSGETDSVLSLTAIAGGDYASYTVKVSTTCGNVTSSAAVLTNGTPVEEPMIYFGTNETGTPPIESEILAGDSVDADPLVDVTVNYGTQSETPVYYWIAIPNTGAAAEKNYWYESVLNQGDMGGEGNLFGDSTTVSVDGQDYFVWITNYATQFTEDDYVFSQE